MGVSRRARTRCSSAFSLFSALILLFVAFAVRGAEPQPLLFEHASVVRGDPGRAVVIEDGALYLDRGIIAGVGETATTAATVPPGVRSVDATGLWAVPAFIDAWTTAGLPPSPPASRSADAEPDFRAGPTPETRAALRAGITPEHDALAALDLTDDVFDRYRQVGFGAVHVLPTGGYLSGHGAVVTLAARPLRDVVVRARTGIGGSFDASRAGGEYPRSLMGAIAHLRQTLLDARHHARWREFYRQGRRGVRRPPRDPALDALAPLLGVDLPLVFEASRTNDLGRALELARTFQLDLAVAGGERFADHPEAFDRLALAGAPLFLVPESEDEPELEYEPGREPPRVQEERRAQWRARVEAPVALAERDVRFAFATGKERDPRRLLKGINHALERGLEREAALRALTLGAAELLGVGEVLGSIEPGKIASVVLLTRPFGDPEARVRYLVADGELFEFEVPEEREDDEKDEASSEAEDPDERQEADEAKPPSEPAAASEKAGKESAEEAEPPEIPAGMVVECELDSDRQPGVVTGGDVFIRDATVHTVAGAVLEKASIRVRDGKIEAVGADVGPDGIETEIDATGWHVMPGIIDCHSHIAIDGGVNEGTESVTCQVRIEDVVDPYDLSIYRALAGGVTAAHLLHGSANVIGGQCSLIKLKYRQPVEELRAPGVPPTVKFALGENVKRSNSSRRGTRFPITRMGVEAVLRRAFLAAREYRNQLEAHAGALARGERSLEPRRDLRLEALLRILDGDIRVHCHSYRADEILMLLRIAEEFGVKISTLQHVLEGYKVAPEIAAHGAGASTFSDWWNYKFEVIDAIPYNATLMTRAGVVVSLNSDDGELIRHLNYEAAKAMRYGGLSEEEALALVTLNPARQLFIDYRLGSIEPGKDADLAIFDAHPLSVYARCRFTLVDGEVRFERRRDAERANPVPARRLAPPEDTFPSPPRLSAEGRYAIRGARIVPVDAAPIERGTVVIEAGRIAAVGVLDEVRIPPDTETIEGDGLEVYPGFIDAGSHLGLTEISSVRGSVDLGETGDFHPDLRMAVAVNVHSELIPAARAAGITATAVFNNGANRVAGQVGVIQLRGTSTPEAVLFDSVGLQINVRGGSRDPEEEPEWVAELEERFRAARRYEEAQRAAAPRARDAKLEALVPCVRRERPVIFAADDEADIRLALRVAEKLRVRAILRGGRDGWKVAALLEEKGVPVLVGPVWSLPSEPFDPYDAPYANAGRLHAAGVAIGFQSGDDTNARNLPFHIGTAVAFGLPRSAALRALTLGAAEILGVDTEIGSITPGKSADLVITDGDPFEIRTHVRHVFIRGRPMPLETRHTRLYRQFHERLEVPEPAARTRF